MKRCDLKRVCAELEEEFEQIPYSYWLQKSFPEVFTRSVEGVSVNVELDILEETSEYLHVSLSVDDGRILATTFPVGCNFFVPKTNRDGGVSEDAL